jgi:hypothetical protein
MKVSMAISVTNKEGKRYQEGDIVCVRPSGWEWGKDERKRYLIMEVDLGNDIKDISDARKLEAPLFDTGDLWWPSSEDKDGNPIDPPKILSKRRYKIPFTDLTSIAAGIDWKKVVENADYQPIEKTTMLFAGLILDRFTNKKLMTNDLASIALIGK